MVLVLRLRPHRGTESNLVGQGLRSLSCLRIHRHHDLLLLGLRLWLGLGLRKPRGSSLLELAKHALLVEMVVVALLIDLHTELLLELFGSGGLSVGA